MNLRSIVRRLFSLGLAAALATSTGLAQETPPPPVASTTLPVKRTLTAADGRKIDSTILEKSDTAIKIKTANGKEFTVELAKLSPEDQTFIGGLVAPPVKKPTVLVALYDEPVRAALEKAGFEVTMTPIQKRLSATNEEFIEKITDEELKKFDLIWANSCNEIFAIEKKKSYQRFHNLAVIGKLVAWELNWKTSNKKFLTKEHTEHGGRATTQEYIKTDGNLILFNWEVRAWDQKTGGTPVVRTHPEILDQVIVEAKKLIVPQP